MFYIFLLSTDQNTHGLSIIHQALLAEVNIVTGEHSIKNEATWYSRSNWQWGSFIRKSLAVLLKLYFNTIVIILPYEYMPYLKGLQEFTTNWVFRQSSAPVKMGL